MSRLVDRYDVALLDLDGVVYIGPDAVPHAVPSLLAARASGMGLAYVTNNASRPPSVVADHLVHLGLPVEPRDVVTSAQAGARMLTEHCGPGATVLVVGGPGLEEAVRERGLLPIRRLDGDRLPDAVIQGFGPDTTWHDLAEACAALQRGVLWVATNGDLTVPTPRGVAPGNGSFVRMLATVTGRQPLVAGKPERPLMWESIARLDARRPLVVGDRLDTDIEGAVNVGIDSLLVLTGVTGPDDLLEAPPNRRPTYIARDLRCLLEPMTGSGWDDDLADLRVRCHSAWQAADLANA